MTKEIKLAELCIIERLGSDIIGNISSHQCSEPRGNYKNFASKVIKPKSVDEVPAVLSILNEMKVGVVPYSGGTGLVGGQMAPTDNVFLMSLEKMSAVRNVSSDDNTLTVEAGLILSKVQEEAKKIDRTFPLSLASEGTCQIGGNLATNAGGINVLRYGSARDLCLGLEAVFADGTVYNGLTNLIKDNTGYDLRNLLIGSEGTLGVITAATLKVFPVGEETVVSMIKVKNPQAAVVLLRKLEKVFGKHVQAFELISKKGLEFLDIGNFVFKEPFSTRGEWMILVEVSGSRLFDLKNNFQNVLYNAIKSEYIIDAVVAQNQTQAKDLWYIRENMSEANRLMGAICSSDVSVPISEVSNFIFAADKKIKDLSENLQINCFGHLGDGNIHFNVFPPFGKKKAEFRYLRDYVINTIHEEAIKFRGSISAEHGIGRLKVADLKKYGDSGKLESIRLIKKALDPNLILNPGVIISEF